MQQPHISLIVPAYQEEKRVANTMAALSSYLDAKHPGSELILVCDGCTDRTAEVARQAFKADNCELIVIDVQPNQGKGNAVREGMLKARGQYLFFTDADLSFAPEIMDEFHEKLLSGADIAVAQRKKETRYPGLGRRVVAFGSRILIGNLILPGIRDTQAGYKGFKREAARFLFERARIKRFLFDLEILMLARRKGYRIDKVYVDWTDQPGSTVRLYIDTARSLRDLMLIVFWMAFGFYRLKD